MWARGGMVLSILALVGLIVVTPSLLGRPSPELASLPLLIIGMSRNNESYFLVNLQAAVQAYRYDEIRITINSSDAPSVNRSMVEPDTYSYHTWVPSNVTFTVDAYLIDQQGNYFEYNVTARMSKELDNRTVMIFTFPYEKDNLMTEFRRYPPDDFRWVIPRRGTLP